MKAVVLDGFAVNPGDLNWEPLQAITQCTIYDRTPEADILARSRDASILLTNKTPVRSATLAALPRLQYIGVLATGYDVVDVAQAKQQNILVTNVPAYGTHSVAQMVFALLLELCQHVGLHSGCVRQGDWSRNPDWCFWRVPTIELAGKTLGLVGYGRIGKKVGEIARGLGMEVVVHSRRRPADIDPGIAWGTLEEVLHSADFVSLHCPLQEDTRGLIRRARIQQMKQGAYLINTARGALVVEEDLATALNSGRLGGAALDVLTVEPPLPSNPLLTAKNCLITPHIAWATREARTRLLETATANVRMWLAGKPQNVVA